MNRTIAMLASLLFLLAFPPLADAERRQTGPEADEDQKSPIEAACGAAGGTWNPDDAHGMGSCTCEDKNGDVWYPPSYGTDEGVAFESCNSQSGGGGSSSGGSSGGSGGGSGGSGGAGGSDDSPEDECTWQDTAGCAGAGFITGLSVGLCIWGTGGTQALNCAIIIGEIGGVVAACKCTFGGNLVDENGNLISHEQALSSIANP